MLAFEFEIEVESETLSVSSSVLWSEANIKCIENSYEKRRYSILKMRD
jgi:hypothetical protein